MGSIVKEPDVPVLTAAPGRSTSLKAYPTTDQEFNTRFHTEKACRKYLNQLRWPRGFSCPRCGGRKAWPTGRSLLHCAACGRQTSATAGTVLQDIRCPLRTWFRAAWWFAGQESGASALGLQHAVGLGSYQTAWTILHKLRQVIVRPGIDRLVGRVEVGEVDAVQEEFGTLSA